MEQFDFWLLKSPVWDDKMSCHARGAGAVRVSVRTRALWNVTCLYRVTIVWLFGEEVFKTRSSYNCFINYLVSPVYQGVLISTNRDAMF